MFSQYDKCDFVLWTRRKAEQITVNSRWSDGIITYLQKYISNTSIWYCNNAVEIWYFLPVRADLSAQFGCAPYREYFMGSARVRGLFMNCEVSIKWMSEVRAEWVLIYGTKRVHTNCTKPFPCCYLRNNLRFYCRIYTYWTI